MLERAEGSSIPLANRSLSPTEQQLSTQLYFVLVMLLKGRALDVACNVGNGEVLRRHIGNFMKHFTPGLHQSMWALWH